ncbi:MAG: diaminopimelate decarboxylase [Acutalibacteraceae bacterium]|nr:diaminopimelate decarboxylase [Acutalibacteraceae bacterium]
MKMLNENLKVNENGHLLLGGCDTVQLANEYGTPLYVYDENQIVNNCRMFKNSMEEHYNNSLVIYASKAFNCKEMCRLVNREGLGLDVVSGGELYTAKSVGFPMDRVFFHGNNKTNAELELALDYGVHRIVVDNLYELERLNDLAAKKGVVADIMMRIKPGIDAHTHDFVRTGQIDSKFGFALENGEAFEAVKLTKEFKNINLEGLHCHIGSQIFDNQPFVEAATVMLNFYKKIKDELGLTLADLNLGGGFGIKYTENDTPLAYDRYMGDVAKAVHEFCDNNGLAVPRMLIEPGRSIVGATGVTLYTVGSVKEIENVRNYVAIDGGMTDNPRYALYKSEYTVVNATKADKECDYVATVAGKCCESGDLIGEHMSFAKPDNNDILAVLSTGAYNYSMASNYNRIPRPAVVMCKDGESRIIINRESYEDIIKNDI